MDSSGQNDSLWQDGENLSGQNDSLWRDYEDLSGQNDSSWRDYEDSSGQNGSLSQDYEGVYGQNGPFLLDFEGHNWNLMNFYDDDYSEYDIKDEQLKQSVKIASLVIYSQVFVLGVSGNRLVIWVTGFKMKKTINTVWYLNLAVADFLFTALLPLRITESALDGLWPFGKFMCKVYWTVLFLNMYASIYILMVISVDRCVCVVWPVWAKIHRSVRKASCVSVGVWVLALALSSPYFVFRDIHISIVEKCSCRNSFTSASAFYNADLRKLRRFRHGAMIVTRFLMGFVVPFTVIVSCYSVVIHRIRRNRSLASRSGRGRPFKILAAVIAAFFLCWAPYHVTMQILLMKVVSARGRDTLERVSIVAFCLAYINSCLNPLLYVFMGHDFKDEVRRSVLKVLEKAFTEEPPQTNASTDPGSTSQETAGSEAQV